MTRRPVVNRDEVFSIADRMAAQGKKVTALSILAALGGGSLTTIYKHMEEWESLHKTATPASSGEDMPEVVRKAFLNIWKMASAEASRELAATRFEVEQLQQNVQELQAQVGARERQRDAAVKEAAELRGQLKSLKEQNSQLLTALGKRKKR